MSKNREQCRKCGRSRKLTFTRAGPLCKWCTDRLPPYLHRTPRRTTT
jgi:hypothetical protein